MSTTIEQLEIQVQSSSNSAAKGIDALASTLGKLKKATRGAAGMGEVATTNNAAAKSYVNLAAKVSIAYVALKRIASVVSGWIHKSTKYIEDVNLFSVSMGKYAEEASRYAEKVAGIMGIDPGEWMRNQGLFMTLATGFGIVSDRAYTMSQNLTQLGYDLSSFFNISYEDAMAKLQSGIAGELEPLRRIGYDLSVARLQQEAYTLGIQKKVSAMTQAEKAELRYYAIMTQVTVAQGDMARTLENPSNQLRILKAQVEQAGRALGNIFIPILNAVLPVAIAVAQAIRMIADAIASFFGFSLPEVSFGGVGDVVGGMEDVSDSVGGVEDNLSDATDKAKELKNALLGIDELNVISPPEDAGTTAGKLNNALGGLGGAGGLGFELPTYDFISDAINTQVDKIMKKLKPAIEWIKEHLDDLLDVVKAIGLAFLAWKVTKGITDLIKAIKNGSFNKLALGISLMVAGVSLSWDGAFDIGYEGLTFENFLKTAIGNALTIGGSLLTFGTGPAGWIIGIGTALVVDIIGITVGMHQRALEDDLKKRFGELVLTVNEAKEWAEKITRTELGLNIDLYVKEVSKLEELEAEIKTAISTLDGMNFRIALGLDVPYEDYQLAVDEFVGTAQEYLNQKQVTATMAVSIMLDGTTTGERLTEFASTFYAENYARVGELGEKLKDAIAEGFVDGEWIPNKMEEALKLQKEIQEILEYVSDVEYEAKIQALKLDALHTELSVESFEEIMNQANAAVEEQMANSEGLRLESLKVARMEFDQNIKEGMARDAAETLYNDTVDEIELAFRNAQLELSYGTVDFGMDTIMTRYKEEVTETIPFFRQTTEELFVQGPGVVLPEQTYDNVETLFLQLRYAYESGFANLDVSDAARENIGRLLETVRPQVEEWERLAEEYRAAGQSIPEHISQGLHDYNTLAAISGDARAINYLLGEHFSTDTAFLEMLGTVERAGATVGEVTAQGLLNQVTLVEDAAAGVVRVMKDGVELTTWEITPTLVENMNALGVNLTEGLVAGAETSMQENRGSIMDWAIWPWNWFKEANEIHSPSKVFERGGEFIVEGLNNGLSTYTSTKTTMTTWGKSIIDWFIGSSHGKVNEITFAEFATKMITGFKNKVNASYIDTKSSITTWAAGVKNWFISPAYGAINRDTFAGYARTAILGFENGIIINTVIATNAMRNLAIKIREEFEKNMSRDKFQQIAREVVDGFNSGINQYAHTSISYMQGWGSQAGQAFKEAFEAAISTIDLPSAPGGGNTSKRVAVDTSAYTYRSSDSYSGVVTTGSKTTVSSAGYEDSVSGFFGVLEQIASDVRKQADKDEETVIEIDGRKVSDTVTSKKKANGYVFAK